MDKYDVSHPLQTLLAAVSLPLVPARFPAQTAASLCFFLSLSFTFRSGKKNHKELQSCPLWLSWGLASFDSWGGCKDTLFVVTADNASFISWSYPHITGCLGSLERGKNKIIFPFKLLCDFPSLILCIGLPWCQWILQWYTQSVNLWYQVWMLQIVLCSHWICWKQVSVPEHGVMPHLLQERRRELFHLDFATRVVTWWIVCRGLMCVNYVETHFSNRLVRFYIVLWSFHEK